MLSQISKWSLVALVAFSFSGLKAEPVASVDIKPVSVQEDANIKKAFLEANPQFTQNIVLSPYGQVFRAQAKWSKDGEIPSEEKAIEIAKEFLAKNFAALGIPEADLWDLEYKFVKNDLFSNVSVTGRNARYEGYRQILDFTYNVRVALKVVDGKVVLFINRTDRLPDFPQILTDASIGSDDAAIRRDLIGKELFYSSFSGEQKSAGIIASTNLQQTTLTISGAAQEDNSIHVELAWKFLVVMRGSLSWTFYYSAHTGKLLRVQQNFAT